jgi:N-[(2S)-2-amino-2-carboxyethyl]-L-glutamate dehydrogenase
LVTGEGPPDRRGADGLLYLGCGDVQLACSKVDVVEVVRAALVAYESGRAELPEEAYLAWTTPSGGHARSLNMPGWLRLTADVAGTKIINSNPRNPVESSADRANGLTALFDCETGVVVAAMEAATISRLRTAAVTTLGVEALHGGDPSVLAVIGCGILGLTHVAMLSSWYPALGEVRLYDMQPGKVAAFLSSADAADLACADVIREAAGAREAVDGADVVVTATTATLGYLPLDWLEPGAFVSHVSLDDLLPDALFGCDRLFVDSVALVEADERRILGRLMRSGQIGRPGLRSPGTVRLIDGQLGGVLAGSVQAPSTGETVVLNPFGLSIEDIAVAGAVLEVSRACGLGVWLER